MKTLKNILLVMLITTLAGSVKAQCIWSTYASASGANVQFYAYIDSGYLSATSYYWDFGDGDTSQTFSPLHSYAQSGTYNYCFHYYTPTCYGDSCGTITINVCDFNPQINFSQNDLTGTFGGN